MVTVMVPAALPDASGTSDAHTTAAQLAHAHTALQLRLPGTASTPACLAVDNSAERAAAYARCVIHGALQREGAGRASEASRSAGDRVDLDDRERGGACRGRLSDDGGGQGVAVRRSECCGTSGRHRRKVDRHHDVLSELPEIR